MEKYSLNELRKMFLEFYESKGHLRLESFSLVPHNDKSLLLINSGMAPLKPYFIGEEVPPKKRVTTCQKCIRTPDIDNVGKTARHGTFFEMLGNFSFGDYFKKEAIAFAWEFLTEKIGLDKDKLYVSVYENDDEAAEIWKNDIGLTDDRITRLGKEDNFWEIGLGPCGPCSEIYVDRGEEYGCDIPTCGVGCDCDRYMEVWNLVFTQFDKDKEGNYNKLEHPNIDTGMGLERLAAYVQEVDNIFEVDTIRYILDYICEISGKKYGENENDDVSIRVITDHIRSSVFMASDGILTSNEGRGYVLKRILRRAMRHGKLLGIEGHFMEGVAKKVIEISGEAYPALKEKETTILKLINIEEEKFNETVNQGLSMIDELIENLKGDTLDGLDAFKLYDTYGFPLELTEEILEEKGLKVDKDGFEKAMQEQKDKARNARSNKEIVSYKGDLTNFIANLPSTEFTGYESLSDKGKIIEIIKDNEAMDTLNEGESGLVIFDRTPFYATSGGQVHDIGKIEDDKVNAKVKSVTKSGDKFVHEVEIISGSLEADKEYSMTVDKQNRLNTERNHSATHLLHKALKEVLGEHVNQAGSYVDSERLRFDFSHFEKVTNEELDEIERRVNAEILNKDEVNYFETNIDEARKLGATALFGEKYGSKVRVVKMGDYSIELCGGCHVNNTNDISMFKILSESSVASGVRRIEAITGKCAIEESLEKYHELQTIKDKLRLNNNNIIEKVDELLNKNKSLLKELEAFRKEANKDVVSGIIDNAFDVNGTKCVFAKVDGLNMNDLRELSDKVKDKVENVIVFLVSVSGEKGFMIASASKETVKSGFNCGKFIKDVAVSIGSGGGGRPDMAQAGIKDISKADMALENAKGFIKERL
ncbi:alanine--tRNA ligase [Anaerofustis stercorihominis]|uniref:alanine--tRNA ligase n=1 Tax=Anaerofustis stercorihominis TaxID=214853 RepID=UPI00214C6365|nr:alanine--tRNA ligase [Anaerofustis stercorihominis]MCR2033583.1 alanine--tRNA ligase [Anaerofustis stercorihominis]